MLWERSVVEQRYDAIMEVVRDGLPMSLIVERYGVARQSVHAWLRRDRAEGRYGLADRSHRPASCPHQMPAALEARVCELRRAHPGWGPQRLRYELARARVEPVPSRSGVYRALVRNGLLVPDVRRRRRRDYRRWERERPMQLWQMDAMGGVRLADGRQAKLVTGLDDHSRFCVAAGVVQ